MGPSGGGPGSRHTGCQVGGDGVLVIQVHVGQGVVQLGVPLVDVVTGLLVRLAGGVTTPIQKRNNRGHTLKIIVQVFP